MNDGPGHLSLHLTADEAIVLFEWLARFHGSGDASFQDQAEQRALWNLECMLERDLVAPLRDDYDELLAAARDRLRDPDDEPTNGQTAR